MELEEKEKAEKKKRGPKPSSVRFKKHFCEKALGQVISKVT